MSIAIVSRPDYKGDAGVQQVRNLQQALVVALKQQDWIAVKRQHRSCAALIDKVVAANRCDGATLVLALSELKGVYSNLIDGCQEKVASMAV
jgi:hypothetical protein